MKIKKLCSGKQSLHDESWVLGSTSNLDPPTLAALRLDLLIHPLLGSSECLCYVPTPFQFLLSVPLHLLPIITAITIPMLLLLCDSLSVLPTHSSILPPYSSISSLSLPGSSLSSHPCSHMVCRTPIKITIHLLTYPRTANKSKKSMCFTTQKFKNYDPLP